MASAIIIKYIYISSEDSLPQTFVSILYEKSAVEVLGTKMGPSMMMLGRGLCRSTSQPFVQNSSFIDMMFLVILYLGADHTSRRG